MLLGEHVSYFVSQRLKTQLVEKCFLFPTPGAAARALYVQLTQSCRPHQRLLPRPSVALFVLVLLLFELF